MLPSPGPTGITVPGEGIAFLDAGNVVFDAEGNVIFEGGPHQFLHDGPALICAALDLARLACEGCELGVCDTERRWPIG